MSLHGMLDDWTVAKGSFKKRVYLSIAGRTMLERASWVHCTAEIEKLQSSTWYPRGRTVVAPLPFDLLPYQSLTGPQFAHERFPAALKTDAPKWLFVGRLHPIKRIELLLEACRILADQGTHGHVLIAGSGDREYEQTLRAKVNELELTDRVYFLGFVTGREKTSLYQAVDGVILPSAHESFGYSAIEALACGTPVITTKAVNIWQELQQSGGAVIAGGYADDLALAMARIKAMPDARAQLGKCGQRWVFDQLHPDRVAVQYEQMYRNAANG
jgi:glycosyltransferase involved in cell wall biosynthesis